MPEQEAERKARYRAIVARYESLGAEGERALWDTSLDGSRPPWVVGHALSLYSSSSRSHGVMLEGMRESLRKEIESDFEEPGRHTLAYLRILGERGVEADIETLEAFATNGNYRYIRTGRLALGDLRNRLGLTDSASSGASWWSAWMLYACIGFAVVAAFATILILRRRASVSPCCSDPG